MEMVRKQSPALSPRPRDILRNKQKLSSLSWNLKNSETQNFLNSLLHPHLTDHAFAPRYVFNVFFFFCSRKTILNLIVLDLLYPLFVYVDFEFHCWNNSIPLRFLIIIANQSQNLVQFSYYCTFLDVYRKYIYILLL